MHNFFVNEAVDIWNWSDVKKKSYNKSNTK